MVDKELISDKLSRLRYYLGELEKATDINWSKFQADIRSKAFVERFIHLSIEEIFDICNHIIAFNKWREPQSFRDLFDVLHENNVIKDTDLKDFQQMASFRNILVHRYDKIEDEIVFGIFNKKLSEFNKFIDRISEWLKGDDP